MKYFIIYTIFYDTNIYLSLLAGCSAKAYDDLNDNYVLQYLKNDTFMEFLKGIHYILFTTIGIENPLYFYFSYAANALHNLTSYDSYSEPYEHSLFYSFLLLFVIIYYKKDIVFDLCYFDCIIISLFLLGAFLEPIISAHFFENKKNKEFSISKLFCRISLLLSTIVCLLISESNTTRYLFSYHIGYFIISIASQAYSIFITFNEKKELKEIKRIEKKKNRIEKKKNRIEKKKNRIEKKKNRINKS